MNYGVGRMRRANDGLRTHGSERRARVLLVGAAILGSTGGMLFNQLLSSRLDGNQVSDVRVVLAGLSAVGFFTLGLQLAIVGSLGAGPRRPVHLPARFGVRVGIAGIAVGLLGGAVSFAVVSADSGFRLVVAIQVAVAIAAMMLAIVPRAELLAEERWLRVGVLLVVEPAVRLLVGSLLLSERHPRSNLLPIVVAQLVITALAYALRPGAQATTARPPSPRHLFRGAMGSVGLLITVALSSVAFRSRLGIEADLFNESAVFARAIVFLPLTVTLLFLPSMARSPSGTGELRRAFLTAILWTAVISITASTIILVFADDVGGLLLAGDDTTSAGTAQLLVISASMLSLATVSILMYVSHGSALSLAAWASAAIAVGGQLLATTAMQLAVATTAAAFALLIMVLVPALLRVQPILHVAHSDGSIHRSISGVDVTVVIPSYNPGPSVVDTVRSVDAHLRAAGVEARIVVVSDGSTDGSDRLLDEVDLPRLTHLRHSENRGKGAALRTGFAEARSPLVGFIDADGDLPPALMVQLLEARAVTSADIAFGSKLHPDSSVRASLLRRIYSAGYRTMIRVLFRLDVRDTQTGVKLFTREVIDAVLPNLHESAFALDLELFIAARAAGFETFVEVPVTLARETGSTITPAAVRRMIVDTLRLFWRARVTLKYQRSVLVAQGTGRATVGSDSW